MLGKKLLRLLAFTLFSPSDVYEVGRLVIGDETALFPLPLAAENGDGGARECTFEVEPCLPLRCGSGLVAGSDASGDGEPFSGHVVCGGDCSFCNLFDVG